MRKVCWFFSNLPSTSTYNYRHIKLDIIYAFQYTFTVLKLILSDRDLHVVYCDSYSTERTKFDVSNWGITSTHEAW